MIRAVPCAAHLAIAQMHGLWPHVTLITQNADDLHELTGSKNVIHLVAVRARGSNKYSNNQIGEYLRCTTKPEEIEAYQVFYEDKNYLSRELDLWLDQKKIKGAVFDGQHLWIDAPQSQQVPSGFWIVKYPNGNQKVFSNEQFNELFVAHFDLVEDVQEKGVISDNEILQLWMDNGMRIVDMGRDLIKRARGEALPEPRPTFEKWLEYHTNKGGKFNER